MIQNLDITFVAGQRLPASDLNTIVEKINQVISAVNSSIGGSEDVTRAEFEQAIAELTREINGKASSSEVSTLSGIVEQLGQAVEGKASIASVNEAVQQLQTQINELHAANVTTNLVNDNPVLFATGFVTEVNFTATSFPLNSTIVFGEHGSSDTQTAEDTQEATFKAYVHSDVQAVKTFDAQFTVLGINKGIKQSTVTFVFPIFYGAGATRDQVQFVEVAQPKATPAGDYSISLPDSQGNYIFFEVPSEMTITGCWLDNSVFLVPVELEQVSTPRVGTDGTAYKCYKSTDSFISGTFKFKVN